MHWRVDWEKRRKTNADLEPGLFFLRFISVENLVNSSILLTVHGFSENINVLGKREVSNKRFNRKFLVDGGSFKLCP